MKNPERFILIDDELYSNKISTILIKRIFANVEVLHFIFPQQGLDYITTEYATRPVATVLLLDINMPVLSGWAVLEKLGALSVDIREHFTVFMLSSSVDPQDKQKATDNPFVAGYIEKPLSREILQNMFNQ